jgi:esterase/lipase superfamily enzyme
VHVEEHLMPSEALGHDMAFRVYGHDGRPVVAFPSQDGRYTDVEGFGLVESIAHLIEAGRMRLVAVDGVDWQSWTNASAHPADRARRHEAYDRHIAHEIVPWVRERTGWATAWATGASMGAYHAANVVFRHPDRFDGLIAMSGVYQMADFTDGHVDETVYLHSPLFYLPNLDDPWYLDRLRTAKIAIVVGQGAWEEPMLTQTRILREILAAKGIPAIVDEWGRDVDHDWPWWRRMLPHYLERLGV